MTIMFTILNKEARVASKILKAAGAKPTINKTNLQLYSFLATKSNIDVLVNSKEIVDGIMKRPDSAYSISGILNQGLKHVLTILPQQKINPMKAIKEVFAVADNNPKGLKLIESIVDSEKFHTIPLKEVVANGILPAIEKASPENIETFEQLLPMLKPQSLNSQNIKDFLAKNVNLY